MNSSNNNDNNIVYYNLYVTGSGKSRLKSPMIKQQKLAKMPFR